MHPAGCIESGCAYLYLFDDEDTGQRFMGCMNKVFRAEIDVQAFEPAQRTRHGFGGVKMTGRRCPNAAARWSAPTTATASRSTASTRASSRSPLAVEVDDGFDLRDRL